MCLYLLKTEDQCSRVMEKAVMEAFDNNMYYHDTMKTIVKAYVSNHECSVQLAVYHIFQELMLRRIWLCFLLIPNLLKKRVQILFPEKELSKLPDDCPNIFKRLNIDRYMEGSSTTFCNGKYSVLNRYPNESDSEEGEINKTFSLPNFIPQILPDDEMAECLNTLNS